MLHGQRNQHNLANSAASNKKQQAMFDQQSSYEQREPLLAFFGVCIPFGPPSLLEMPSKDSVFKSKHRLDLSIISMDSRGKQLLGLNDLTSIFKQATGSTSPNSGCSSPVPASGTCGKLQVKLEAGNSSGGGAKAATGSGAASQAAATKQQSISAYDLVHQDDLSYMASAHQELLKTGASGLIAYRMITQAEGKHQWLQTSAKLYYKNSKPDFILCTHRPLMEEEGRDLLGKRTMDFKVTYLDVGLSSINDRILACDKFSSLQALGNASNKPIKSPSLANSNGGSNNRRHQLASSPALSGESSRSLASSSPQSMLNETNSIGEDQSGRQAKGTSKRKFNYDLDSSNSHLHQQQYAPADYEAGQQNPAQQASAFLADGNSYNTHYKRAHNGDIFYDMDTVQAVNANSDDLLNCVGSRKSSTAKKKASGKVSGKQTSKKRTELVQNGQTGNQVMGKGGKLATQDQQAVAGAQQHQQQVDHQQLHLYNSHYNPHHLQSAAEVTADSYPAIQAAAVYAASLGHPHSAASVQHQAYGASVNHHHHHHHGYHNQTASQSAALYGSGSIVSPSAAAAAAYSQHQHQHQHHSHLAHHLDSAGYQAHYSAPTAFASNQTGAVGQSVAANYASAAGSGAAAAAAAAAASSFLPAEHLLHHYSQSAARSAALAAWPSTPASSASSNQADHYHQQQHQQQHHHSSHQAAYGASAGNWGGSAAAAAAAALVASANSSASAESTTPNSKRDLNSYSPAGAIHQDQHYTSGSQARLSATEQQQQYHQQRHQLHHQQQHHHQQQQQQQNSSPTMESSSPSNKSSSSSSRYTNLAGQTLQSQLPQKSNAPASLSSDGCAHRSPLSSGESSNGSASLAAAQAVAAASAMAASSQEPAASMISPSAYYLSSEHSQQQQHQQHQQNQHQQHQQHQQQQQQSYAAHQSQQLAAYHHQNPYAAVAQQYGDSSAAHFNQHHYQHHHNQHHHHHHQQAVFEHQHAAAYFQHTSGDLSAAASSAAAAHTVSASAVKLYGANGKLRTAAM